jgi:hypothetical protein
MTFRLQVTGYRLQGFLYHVLRAACCVLRVSSRMSDPERSEGEASVGIILPVAWCGATLTANVQRLRSVWLSCYAFPALIPTLASPLRGSLLRDDMFPVP